MGLNWFKSKPAEVDHGPFVPHPCPVCGKRALHLVEVRMAGLLGSLGFCGGLRIRCAGCSHSILLEPYEADAAFALKKHADAFRAGTMTEEQFAGCMENSSLLCLHELAQHGSKWTCPRCAAEVPPTFEICWKCQTPRPDMENAVAVADAASEPDQPDAIFGSSAPAVVHEAPPAAAAAGPGRPGERDASGTDRR